MLQSHCIAGHLGWAYCRHICTADKLKIMGLSAVFVYIFYTISCPILWWILTYHHSLNVWWLFSFGELTTFWLWYAKSKEKRKCTGYQSSEHNTHGSIWGSRDPSRYFARWTLEKLPMHKPSWENISVFCHCQLVHRSINLHWHF